MKIELIYLPDAPDEKYIVVYDDLLEIGFDEYEFAFEHFNRAVRRMELRRLAKKETLHSVII